MTPILILAAGASRRMNGTDKLLQEIDGVPLLVRTVRRAVDTGQPCFVAIPGAQHPRYAYLRREQVTCFDIPDAQEGIGGTLRGAVSRLPTCDAFMVLLADLPDLEADDMLKVFNARRNHPNADVWRGSTDDGKPGHPIVFSAATRPHFENLSGDFGAKSVISDAALRVVPVPLNGNRARRDLDSPEDWKNWLETQNSKP